MLTSNGIREVLVDRLDAAQGQCNSSYLDHFDGVVRGLLWALTGSDPGTYLSKDVARLLTLAGIPVRVDGEQVVHATHGDPEWPDDESTAPTDRRLQVIARLLDVTAMGGGYAADFVETTRADYPDVFADLDSHLRQVRHVATTEPDATVIDEPADPATWVRTYERATSVAQAGEPPPAMAGPLRVGPVSKLREALGIAASASPLNREKAWLQDLAEQGVRIVHPDDGWVDREANTVQFIYPTMQYAMPAPGVLVALGTPEKWRVVMLKREVRQPVGGSRWAFVEQPAVDRQRPPDANPLTGELPKRAALLPKEIYVDDIIGGVRGRLVSLAKTESEKAQLAANAAIALDVPVSDAYNALD